MQSEVSLYFRQIEMFTGLFLYSFVYGKRLLLRTNAKLKRHIHKKYAICVYKDASFLSESNPEQLICDLKILRHCSYKSI